MGRGVGLIPLDITNAGRNKQRFLPMPSLTGGAGSPAAPFPAPVLLPPTFFPWRGSRRLFSQQSATISNAAPAVVATVTLLATEVGVISDIEIGVNTMLITSVITWAVRFNGSPIEWGPLSLIPRAATYAGDAWSALGLPVPMGVRTVDVLATVGPTDGATYLLGASITGWSWTTDLEENVRAGRIAG
jgi:hypothetical protein